MEGGVNRRDMEEQEKRKPPKPWHLLGAFQDRPEPTPTKARVGKAVRAPSRREERNLR